MEFNDDDLKRLKELRDAEEDDRTERDERDISNLTWGKLPALLARLEAAERFRSFVLEAFPNVTCDAFIKDADESWQTAAGK